MDNKEKALLCHKQWNGKLETIAKSKVNSRACNGMGAYKSKIAERAGNPFPACVHLHSVVPLSLCTLWH